MTSNASCFRRPSGCVLALGLWVSSAVTAHATPPRPLTLTTRSITAEALSSIPESGVVYLWSERPLSPAELRIAEQTGLRFYGLVEPLVYAFQVEKRSASGLMSRTTLPFVGTASAVAEDKLGPTLVAKLAEGTSLGELGLDLIIRFWPGAQAGDVRSLLGESTDARLPTLDTAPLMEADSVWVSADKAQGLDLETLIASPAVALVDALLPRVISNTQSRLVSGSNTLANPPYNARGSGIVVGVWDGGPIQLAHAAFDGRVEYFDNVNIPISDHATHVSGTIVAGSGGNPAAQGHAPLAEVIGFDFNGNIPGERRAAKHVLYHYHDNHSWGLDPATVVDFSTYDQLARLFDFDARDILLLPVKAAGNEGLLDQNTFRGGGYDSLSPDSTGKNALVVGAVYPESPGGQYRLAEFSSRGPVEDGRVKPDITAVGVGVLSTISNNQYATFDGTSMATPAVSGMLALLAEIFEKGRNGRRMAPDLARGILIHTADDAGNVGPDYHFGWGVARADHAAELIEKDRVSGGAYVVRGAVQNGESRTYSVAVSPGQPVLKVTTTWLDPASIAVTALDLINDLDLVLIAPDGTRHQPWVLNGNSPSTPATTGRNSVDNVEQVVVNNPIPGIWQVTVTGTSISDPVNPVQGFVLFSDQAFGRQTITVGGAANSPLNDNQTVEVPLVVNENQAIGSMRVFVDIQHERRGDLVIQLVHPDGTSENLETADASTFQDIFAIFPDTRSQAGILSSFVGKSTAGTWRLRIQDTQAEGIGTLRYAAIEFDVVGPPNVAPSAVIQGLSFAPAGQAINLSATASTDADGDTLSYAWDQRLGPTVTIGAPTQPSVSVQLPNGPIDSQLVFGLVVTDSRGASSEALHTVTLEAGNRANQSPVITLRAPSRIASGVRFVLDASQSFDADGDILEYIWRQLSGPAAVSSIANGAQWLMEIPPSPNNSVFEFELRATDGRSPPISVVASIVVDSAITNPNIQDISAGDDNERSRSLTSVGCRVSSPQDLAVWLGLLVVASAFGRARRREYSKDPSN